MAMKILDLYRAILRCVGLTADEEGYISSVMVVGEKTPSTINGKVLVLPTSQQLKSADRTERIVFHPLSENILHGESEVLSYLRRSAVLRINITFAALAAELMQIATSPAEHSKLNPDQQEFLYRVKDADATTYEHLRQLTKAMPPGHPSQSFCSIYLKRSGSIGTTRYSRVGVVSFPLYEALKAAGKDRTVFGVNLRVKDVETLIGLLEYMVPGIAKPEAHNQGSNSLVAPFLDALMKTVRVIAAPMNDIIELFRDQLTNPEMLEFDASWVETFDNLDQMLPEIRSIPMQAGNEGSAAGVSPAAAAPAAARPTATVHPQAVAAPGGYQPPPGYALVQVAAPAPPPAPVKTAHGVSFSSLVAASPALQQAAPYTPVMGGYGQPAQLNPRNAPPRWAQPGGFYGAAQQPQPAPGYGYQPAQPGYGPQPGYGYQPPPQGRFGST